MEYKLQQAYESLVPRDQLIIDAMIVTLAKKDRQIRDLVQVAHEQLEEPDDA